MKDQVYFKALAEGLKIKDTRSLSIIMGPSELKETLANLSMDDFDDGRRLITLHTHTTVSDGRVDPKDYLDNALRFKQENGYRELLLAVTDHDFVDALPIVLRQAQKNPNKYKGIRVVLGCELSVSHYEEGYHRPVDFELLHYGINPFDKKYIKWLSELRATRQKAIPEIFNVFRERYPYAGLDMEEFYNQNPLMRKGFGFYLAYITPRYIIEKVNDSNQNDAIWDYFRRLGWPMADDPDMPFWHTLDDVVAQLKQHKFGFLSVAHPYRIQLTGKVTGDGNAFLKQLLSRIKEKGVAGMEIFYANLNQPLARSLDYMLAGNNPYSDTDKWVRTILDFATENNMIKTGGTDTHTSFLAGRKRKLVQDLIACLNKYKPLIQQGYRVLNKEVTLGLPAPCMPPESAYRNTGIGSAWGKGAKRVNNLFGGMFDKIQLGPMGRTNKESKHSPYVSDSSPNPFLIPLETLADQGLISQKTMDALYDIPKPEGKIDFEIVERVYEKALKEAYQTSKTKKSYDEFIKELTRQCQTKTDIKYIADLQVRIPPDTPGLKDSMFLKEFVLGTPGDALSPKPRIWNFPVFDPKQIFDESGNLGPAGRVWHNLIDSAMKNAKGGLRIDHFIGFVNPFVVSTKNPDDYGRLYTSPGHPILGVYAKDDLSDITRKIIIDCAQKNGLTIRDIYAEDIGSRPPELDDVMHQCGLGRLLVAQFFDPSDWNHVYHLSQARPDDVAVLDTHDTPSIQAFFSQLPADKRAQLSWILASDLRFNYTDSLQSLPQMVRMQWGALMASPAERVQAFFTSWTGQPGRYNEPGNPVKWQLRCLSDFEQIYFENLAKGLAYNPFDAICLAIYARGDDFYRANESLVQQLRQAESEVLTLAQDL